MQPTLLTSLHGFERDAADGAALFPYIKHPPFQLLQHLHADPFTRARNSIADELRNFMVHYGLEMYIRNLVEAAKSRVEFLLGNEVFNKCRHFQHILALL